jgi:NADH:ubiquinone oxidoreductase subunit 5 (subunit L)/multisubunit Na+/H+ antiporter MnhA subunit
LEHSVSHAHAAEFQPGIALLALALALIAIFTARTIYGQGPALTENGEDPLYANAGTRAIWSFANARMYWDQTYFRLFENPFNVLSRFLANTLDQAFLHDYFHNTILWKGFDAIGQLLAKPVDLGIIDGIVNGVGRLARWISRIIRPVQTGYVRTYAVTLLLGVVLVIVILLLPLLTTAGQ